MSTRRPLGTGPSAAATDARTGHGITAAERAAREAVLQDSEKPAPGQQAGRRLLGEGPQMRGEK